MAESPHIGGHRHCSGHPEASGFAARAGPSGRSELAARTGIARGWVLGADLAGLLTGDPERLAAIRHGLALAEEAVRRHADDDPRRWSCEVR